MDHVRVIDRAAPEGARLRPSITLKFNPSEVTRWLGRRSAARGGRQPEAYPPGYKSIIRAAWPQPSPWSADQLPPSVLHVPHEEVYDFLTVIASRASRTLWTGLPKAAAFALGGEGLEPVDEAEFVRICTETAFASLLCPTLDPPDREGFAPILARLGTESGLFKIDATAMGGADTLPGVHVAPTVTLLQRGPRGLSVLGIRVEGRLFTPEDGDAWELLKYFVLQSCAMQTLLLQHPRVHFPYDAIAAITPVVLPAGHRLRRLLSPHFGFQLAQDFAALYVTRSVAHNNQDELYTPFPTLRSGFLHLMKIGYDGMPGNSAYPRWSFQIGAPRAEQEYGRFLATYWDSIFRFTSEVLAGVSPADPAVARWADACAQWVRGFPDASTLEREGTLAATVATIIHNVSVVHAADHHSLYLQPIRKVSLRIRAPAPERSTGFVLDRRALVTRVDVFRYHLGREMYVAAHVVRPLADVDYGFDGEVAPDAVSRFHDDLRAIDRPDWHRFAPLSRIGASIQF